MTTEEVERYARRLAELNKQDEESITEVYFFPAEDEIRLIEVDPTAPSHSGGITAYYFGPDSEEDIPLPSGIAVIPPDEKDVSELPAGWGSWEDARRILPVGAEEE